MRHVVNNIPGNDEAHSKGFLSHLTSAWFRTLDRQWFEQVQFIFAYVCECEKKFPVTLVKIAPEEISTRPTTE